MEKEAASRTFDYSLPAHILNRVRDANKYRKGPTEAMAEAITGIGTEAFKVAEAKRHLDEDIALEQDRRRGLWDDSFENHKNRETWANPELYDQVAEQEAGYKDEYIALINENTPESRREAEKMLTQQAARSTSIQNWKAEMEDNIDYYEKGLFSAALDADGEAQNTIVELNNQKNTTLVYDETDGEMKFRIVTQGTNKQIDVDKDNHDKKVSEINAEYEADIKYQQEILDDEIITKEEFDNEVADLEALREQELTESSTNLDELTSELLANEGSYKNISVRDLQKIKKKYTKAEDVKLGYKKNANAARTLGRENKVGYDWDENASKEMQAQNALLINRENIQGLFYDDFTDSGSSFIKDFEDHPDFSQLMNKGLEMPVTSELSKYDDDGDGKIDGPEWLEVSDNDRGLIIQELLRENEQGVLVNFDIAKNYLAEYMTLKQKQNFQQGQDLMEEYGPTKTSEVESR